MVPLLKDRDETVRDAARETLAHVYPVIPLAVRKALRDKDPKVRYADGDIVSKLVPRSLQDVESDAEKGLLKDDYFDFFTELRRDKDPGIRSDGVRALNGEFLHFREAMSALIEAAHDPDVGVRESAVFAFGNFGPDARKAIPTLVACLKDQDPQVRAWSAQSLDEIDPSDDRAFPALLEAVQDMDGNRFAAHALSRCKSRAKEAVPVLLKMLDAKNFPKATPLQIEGVRSASFFALNKLAPATDAVVPALAALVRDKGVEREVRAGAAETLGEIGSAAKATIPDLENAESEKDLAAVAAEAIERIQRE